MWFLNNNQCSGWPNITQISALNLLRKILIGKLWHRQQRFITNGMLSLHERSQGYGGHVRVEHALRITAHLSWRVTLIRLRAGLTSVYFWAVANTVKYPGKHEGIPFPPQKRVSSSNRRSFLRPNPDIIIIKGWWLLNVWNRETQLDWVCFPKTSVCVCVCDRCGLALYTELY